MITERRQAEQALRQSEEQYRSVVEDTPGLICKFLPDGAITFVNQEYCKFFRKKHDELIGTNIQSTIPKEIRENVMSNIASLTEESPIITFENENIIDDKHSRWMRWTDRALFDNEGQISSIQSFGVDITERRQAEEALHQEQEKAQKYLDIAEVMIMAVNTEGEITLINKKGNRILGYEESELLGRNWFDTCVPERERKERRQILRKMIAGEAEQVVYDNESLVLTRSGEERTIAWHDTVISDEKGHNIGSLSSGEDISKRVRAEHLLNALNQAAIAMGVAQTHQEIFNSVSEELKQLDIFCTLFPLDQAQDKLYTKYLSYESAALIAAEKLGGNKHQDFSFPIEDVDKFREVVREKKTLFIENTEQILQQILPKLARKLSTQIIKILRVPKNISAPLIVEDQVIGVLSIQSDKLTREDVPTATACADQLSSAWNKIELLQNLKNTVEGTIHTIAATVEVRDPYTAGHQKRVSDLAVAIATEMHLSDEKVEGIKMAGIIHDLGKIQVPAEILSNPGKLTELEFQIIQTHPQVGFDLLKNIEFPWPLAQMVLQHHEKMGRR
jgi:PAS domain S-box-containing protein